MIASNTTFDCRINATLYFDDLDSLLDVDCNERVVVEFVERIFSGLI
jgi:hypothetical protein